jgi:site-specific DNA-methyltransferase (adenine-specific)
MTEPNIELLNIDCLHYMKQCEDKQFDLAIVDPPYGILNIGMKITKTHKNGTPTVNKAHTPKEWDNTRPNKEYFYELQRISKNQIVWGGNYFADLLPASGCWFFWDKINGDGSHFADGEFAWTSLKTSSKKFKCSVFDGLRGGKDRIHPTEKPKKLYDWILKNFANEGYKIIDTHLGSGSIALACYDRKFDLVGCEIDNEYFVNANNRLNQHKKQLTLF